MAEFDKHKSYELFVEMQDIARKSGASPGQFHNLMLAACAMQASARSAHFKLPFAEITAQELASYKLALEKSENLPFEGIEMEEA